MEVIKQQLGQPLLGGNFVWLFPWMLNCSVVCMGSVFFEKDEFKVFLHPRRWNSISVWSTPCSHFRRPCGTTRLKGGVSGRKVKPSESKGIYGILGRGAVHPFPARMAPDLALNVVAEQDGPLRVLDPVAGSGTVLAIARSKGHRAIGIDIDPLAVLISRVWTTPVDTSALRDHAIDVLGKARNAFKSLLTRDAYPPKSDEQTRQFVRYWFDDYARKQLAFAGRCNILR